MNLLILGLFGAVIAYQTFVSYRVVRSPAYTPQQRSLQLAIIWLLPGIGAVVCHAVLSEHPAPKPTASSEDYFDTPGHEREHGPDGHGSD